MKKSTRLVFLAILSALFASGCASVTQGPNQQIEVTSSPEGATVVSNGRGIGMTPMKASLSRKQAHTLTIEKAGYKPQQVTLFTVPNKASERFIRFGIDEAFGAYQDLSPSSVYVELDPNILPEEPGDDPFGELAAKIVEVDEQLANSEISAAEHRYILRRLIEFYQP